MKTNLVVLLVLAGALGVKNKVHKKSAEERLIEDLFHDYEKAARPVLNSSDAVKVIFGLTLYQIVDVYEKDQTFTISAFIRQKWFNDILKWNPEDYDNITIINVDPQKIWRPDIVLYNNADNDKTFGGNLDRMNTRAKVFFDGNITWLAPIILISQCSIDVTYFPFDTQNCTMKFGSWTYSALSLDLRREDENADLEKYSPNSEWNLKSARCYRNELEYTCCKGVKYPDVTFAFVVARRSLFFLCNLIFPMTMIGMLTILSFLLPAESGERVSLAITLLLAMTVFMLVVADIIPATSDVVPLVGIFFSASMVEMVVMIVVLCYVMRLYHKGDGDAEVGPWMRKYIYDWLSYKIYIRTDQDGLNNNKKVKEEKRRERRRHTHGNDGSGDALMLNNRLNSNRHQNFDMTVINCIRQNSHNLANVESRDNRSIVEQENSGVSPTESQILITKLDILIEKLKSNDENDRVKNEWRTVAMTIDRCLVIFFFLVYTITLFGCFSIAPGYEP